MHGSALKRRFGPYALVRTLAWLRLCAIAGQSMTVLICTLWMQLPIALLPLLIGIGALAVFAVFAAWRLGQPWPVHELEAILHIAVDTLVFGYLLYFTGGASNPFITLLVLPIALSAAALTIPSLLSVVVVAGLAYLLLLRWYQPLPLPIGKTTVFSLHMLGMGVSFLITAILLGIFIKSLAKALQEQQREVQRIRERALRDEGILAIATQAAGAAHELNTPLATMRTLIPVLRDEHPDDSQLADDLLLLQEQIERCRGILRELVAFGKDQLSQTPELTTLADFVYLCRHRFELLRPEAELAVELPGELGETAVGITAGLRHAVLNLLNNAADASAMKDSTQVALTVHAEHGWLELIIGDEGPGFSEDHAIRLGNSGKKAGLGLGMALTEATTERLDGELLTRNTARGAEVVMRLPLHALQVSTVENV